MGLQEGLVHQLEAGLFFLGADGLDEGGEREVARGAEHPVAGARDEGERLRAERVVRQAAALSLPSSAERAPSAIESDRVEGIVAGA